MLKTLNMETVFLKYTDKIQFLLPQTVNGSSITLPAVNTMCLALKYFYMVHSFYSRYWMCLEAVPSHVGVYCSLCNVTLNNAVHI